MSGSKINTDIAIIGGGIAGLWTLNQLRNAGYSAILFEQEALGSYQTIGSQGMIHGGIKYSLAGAWSGISEAISAMPDVWRDCLQGRGKVDLRNASILSEDFYLWSNAGTSSRVTSFFASKMLRGRVEKVKAKNYPAPLSDPAFKGQVYRLIDMVLDIPSVVNTLADQHREAIFTIDWANASLQRDNGQALIELPGCTIQAQSVVLAAGAGNEDLISSLGGTSPAMQRRPLQQVMVKHQYQEMFYGHCMGANPNPRLTISSHRTLNGDPVWYLGGDLSTEGADEEPEKLIAKARQELHELLPWIDFGESQWQTVRLDRGEPRQSSMLRPDSAFVGPLDSADNVLVAWPTKLSLAPHLGQEIEAWLQAENIMPRYTPDLAPLAALGTPPIASTYWDRLFS